MVLGAAVLLTSSPPPSRAALAARSCLGSSRAGGRVLPHGRGHGPGGMGRGGVLRLPAPDRLVAPRRLRAVPSGIALSRRPSRSERTGAERPRAPHPRRARPSSLQPRVPCETPSRPPRKGGLDRLPSMSHAVSDRPEGGVDGRVLRRGRERRRVARPPGREDEPGEPPHGAVTARQVGTGRPARRLRRTQDDRVVGASAGRRQERGADGVELNQSCRRRLSQLSPLPEVADGHWRSRHQGKRCPPPPAGRRSGRRVAALAPLATVGKVRRLSSSCRRPRGRRTGRAATVLFPVPPRAPGHGGRVSGRPGRTRRTRHVDGRPNRDPTFRVAERPRAEGRRSSAAECDSVARDASESRSRPRTGEGRGRHQRRRLVILSTVCFPIRTTALCSLSSPSTPLLDLPQ